MIFMAADINGIQRLLYTYDTSMCDSVEFCNEKPVYCLSDTALCQDDPEFCDGIGSDTLFIALWEVTGVAEDYEITNQVRIIFPEYYSNIYTITQMSSRSFEWEFEDLVPGIGTPVKIREQFQRVN